ncbi:MAG: lytic murein transglycosylase [Deltaproteobacteria bacterium]|jgi:membrane-bound lytic murein transglycosylase B|nr:lytic murein transglycosylase [Deltaproteobacteria bacterium]
MRLTLHHKKSLKQSCLVFGNPLFFLLIFFSPIFSDFAGISLLHAATRPPITPAAPVQVLPAPVALVAPASFDAVAPAIDASWQTLLARLKEDGLQGQDIEGWFAALTNPYSEKPMGQKVSAAFRSRYIFPPFTFLRKPRKATPLYQDTVTPERIRKSAEYILANPAVFAGIESEYKVEKEVVAALFMVETKLGTYLGVELAFWSLACMALADRPEQIQSYLDALPMTEERLSWVKERLQSRSDWAYKELKAFIEYCRTNQHNPLNITGSPVGAIGLCQFMPSNIAPYAADGNKDGRIDLFSVEDALPSIASYLVKHGWKNTLSRRQRFAVIRRYNHSDIYANTILSLADGIGVYLKNAAKKPSAK